MCTLCVHVVYLGGTLCMLYISNLVVLLGYSKSTLGVCHDYLMSVIWVLYEYSKLVRISNVCQECLDWLGGA